MHRTYESGAVKRKNKEERARKDEELRNKIPCITFFMKERTTAEVSDSIESTVALAPVTVDNESIESSDQNVSEMVANDLVITSQPSQVESTETACVNIVNTFSNDVGIWPDKIPDELKDYWSLRGSQDCQFLQREYTNYVPQYDNTKVRYCTQSMFYRGCIHGEETMRSWICFSPTTGKIYCFTCKLFGNSRFDNGLSTSGLYDWKNAVRAISSHETSHGHKNSLVLLTTWAKKVGRIDYELAKQIDDNINYWKSVLHRVVSVIIFLAERGLAFWGDNETVGSPKNGNFHGILELLTLYYPFLSNHIKMYANKGKGHTSYLSSTICEELISLMSEKMMKNIVDEVISARYFSLSVDSTPDISHCDQLTIIIRYVNENSPVERFLTFLDNRGHTGRGLAETVLKYLKDLGIEIANCRGQTYDNAANMSGIYNGMQTAVREVCPHADFIPCCAHSLDLVGRSAVNCCTGAIAYFDFVQKIFVFFSASAARWQKLSRVLKEQHLTVVKRLKETRWSAHCDATHAVLCGYEYIWEILDTMSEDITENAETRATSKGLTNQFAKLETAIMTEMWDCILTRFNAASKSLQDDNMDLNTALKELNSLKIFVLSLRNRFDEFEESGVKRSNNSQYQSEIKRIQQRNRRMDFDCGIISTNETVLSPQKNFKVTKYIPILDQLVSALDHRVDAYQILSERFDFLSTIGSDDNCTEAVSEAAQKLVSVYSQDLELVQLSEICFNMSR